METADADEIVRLILPHDVIEWAVNVDGESGFLRINDVLIDGLDNIHIGDETLVLRYEEWVYDNSGYLLTLVRGTLHSQRHYEKYVIAVHIATHKIIWKCVTDNNNNNRTPAWSNRELDSIIHTRTPNIYGIVGDPKHGGWDTALTVLIQIRSESIILHQTFDHAPLPTNSGWPLYVNVGVSWISAKKTYPVCNGSGKPVTAAEALLEAFHGKHPADADRATIFRVDADGNATPLDTYEARRDLSLAQARRFHHQGNNIPCEPIRTVVNLSQLEDVMRIHKGRVVRVVFEGLPTVAWRVPGSMTKSAR